MKIIFKSGFTLSEVLITLGVIGVVAAVTMPTLITKYQKQRTVTQLKKVYTEMSQAIKLSELQNGEYRYWDNGFDIGSEAYFNKYLKPFLNGANICKTYSQCGYSQNKPYKNLNNQRLTLDAYFTNNTQITFTLADGTFIMFYIGYYDPSTQTHVSTAPRVFVDINGGKQPNKYGKDFFRFDISSNGSLMPYGYSQQTNCTGTGDDCASKIIKDGWKISDAYPW